MLLSLSLYPAKPAMMLNTIKQSCKKGYRGIEEMKEKRSLRQNY
jgi:hypothetical protein